MKLVVDVGVAAAIPSPIHVSGIPGRNVLPVPGFKPGLRMEPDRLTVGNEPGFKTGIDDYQFIL